MTTACKAFCKACPEKLSLHEYLCPSESYKYLVCGKGCELGVLFEDSTHIYFEWVSEEGKPVPYPAAIRYKRWAKHEVARLIGAGVWDVAGVPCASATV